MFKQIIFTSLIGLMLATSIAMGADGEAVKNLDVFVAGDGNNKMGIAKDKGAGYKTDGDMTPAKYIGNVLAIIYGFLGVIALLLIIYAGFKWMMAEGKQEDINKAKQIITSAVIGLAILMGAYTITAFVISSLAS